MQTITNAEFVNSRARIGKLGTIAGLGGMGAGFVTSFNFELIIASYIFLIFGLLAFNVGRYNSIRWNSRPRVDEILSNALKGLDQKYVLVNYAPGMPSSHVLLSPFGLIHIETRHNDGQITCEGDKWRAKRSVLTWMRGLAEGQLGNPTRSAQMAIGQMRTFLVQRLGADVAEQVPVESVVVFVNPRVDLKVASATTPIVMPQDLKAHVRTPQGRSKVPPEVYRKVQEFMLSANASNEKQDKKVKA